MLIMGIIYWIWHKVHCITFSLKYIPILWLPSPDLKDTLNCWKFRIKLIVNDTLEDKNLIVELIMKFYRKYYRDHIKSRSYMSLNWEQRFDSLSFQGSISFTWTSWDFMDLLEMVVVDKSFKRNNINFNKLYVEFIDTQDLPAWPSKDLCQLIKPQWITWVVIIL